MRVLHVAAELHPYVKIGGLADVVAALPRALAHTGIDVRLVLPAYPALREAVAKPRRIAGFGPAFGAATVDILQGRLESGLPVYLVDAPLLYRRAGNPYVDPSGRDWPDNPRRFALLGWAAAHLALGDLDRNWQADVLHAHDWHAGLSMAYRREHPLALPRTVFTVHNLAFVGPFPRDELATLLLPAASFAPDGLEFFGEGSFMKAGLAYAHALTTVSPTYAREIQTMAFGRGFEGLLQHRAADLHGILNGIDTDVWNPATDPEVAARYDAGTLAGKRACKAALQREFGLPVDESVLLLGVVSRLSHQKGVDLLADAIPDFAADVQLVLLGSGDAQLEARLRALEAAFPSAIAVRIGYDEALSHRLIAGADVITVPSRYEPCGLTQLYGLRYGTLPLVRRVGGLADTVVDADETALAQARATGFVFDAASGAALAQAVRRARALHADLPRWSATVRRAMSQDFSWDESARAYRHLYQGLLSHDAG
jgi:starch synthase